MSSPPAEPSSSFCSDNVILTYLQTLAVTKPGLPHGQPVCVIPSHTITDSESLVQLAADIGPHIAVLQVQADIINDWSNGTIDQLTWLAKKYGFLLWEGSHILNATVDFVGKARESPQVRHALRNIIQKKYTRGVVKAATWAGLATAWAAGVTTVGPDKVDILISSLKDAAYETVATTMKSIQTEISVENGSTQLSSGQETPDEADDSDDSNEENEPNGVVSQQQADAWQEIFANNLGISPRKSSIALTQTITQHTEPSSPMSPDNLKSFSQQPLILPNDDIPPPPLLARGLVLCLPGSTISSFTREYRRISIKAARDNGDFVIGFISGDSFFTNGRGNEIFDDDDDEDEDEDDEEEVEEEEEEERRGADQPLQTLALFSLVHSQLGPNADHDDQPHVFNGDDEEEEDAPMDNRAKYAAQLELMIGRAMEVREENQRRRYRGDQRQRSSGRRSGANILDIPLVMLPS